MDHPKKAQAMADIRAHLEQNGSKNWGSLRTRLDYIAPNTFWRWIRETKAQIAPELLGDASRRRRGEPRLDFLGAYRGLWDDAMLLRSHGLRHDGNNVRDAALVDRSVRLRLRLLKQGLALEAQIHSAAAQRSFYDGLIAEIAKESPALCTRLLNRLRGFSDQCATEQSEEARQVDV